MRGLLAAGALAALLGALLRSEWALRAERARADALHRERAAERAGRTTAERRLREAVQERARGGRLWPMAVIGVIESCFRTRNGTPRQGGVAPMARSRLRLDQSVQGVGPPALEGLDAYSHVWIVFVFHENTNVGGGVKAKVHPPMLDGAKTGLFSTRTPHRPSPIGLSLVRLDRVEGATLHLLGADLVDGTPVLDVKPYLPRFDAPADGLRCPDWVAQPPALARMGGVAFSPEAEQALEAAADGSRLDFYRGDYAALRAAIVEVLTPDVRSTHRRRNQKSADPVHWVWFDNVELGAVVRDDGGVVVEHVRERRKKE